MTMKKVCWRNMPSVFWERSQKLALAVVAAILVTAVQAAEVTGDMALAAAKAWSAENRALSGEMGSPVSVKERRGDDGTLLWHEVAMSGGGCVVASADTEIEPIVAVIDRYDGEIPEGHPLKAMLKLDMRGRLGLLKAKSSSKVAATAASSSGGSVLSPTAARQRAMRKWAKLSGCKTQVERLKAATKSDSGKVMPVTLWSYIGEWSQGKLDHWNQNGWNKYVSIDSLYDKYTPNHYPCGCVATAGAALIQFFGVTTAPSVTRTCYVDGVARSLTTKGGSYDWTLFSSFGWRDDVELTAGQVDLLGRVTYDMGVSLGISYAKSGSGASIYTLARVLRNDYGLADARYVGDITSAEYEKLIYNQVRCGRPVVLSIRDDDSGHAVLAVGYGEDEDSTAYTRVFMGWGGSSDAWYALPNVAGFQYLAGVVTMIGKSSSTVPLCARITTTGGGGAAFEEVSVNGYSGYKTTAYGLLGTLRGTSAATYTVSCRGQSQSVYVGSGLSTIKDSYSASNLASLLPDTIVMSVPATSGELRVYGSPLEAQAAAFEQGKALFVLSGADWCGYCGIVKNYLKGLGAEFTDRFVLYYANIDCDPYGMGYGAPSYAVFDPRVFDYTRGWAASNGRLAMDSGGVESKVQAVLDTGSAAWQDLCGAPIGVEVSGAGGAVETEQYALRISFSDGTEASMVHGVTWSLTSGNAAVISTDGKLTPVAGRTGDVTVSASATLWGKTYTRTKVVRIVERASITGILISGPSVIDLYDVAGGQYHAFARCNDGTTVEVSPSWSVSGDNIRYMNMSSGGELYFSYDDYTVYQCATATVTAAYGAFTAASQTEIFGPGYVRIDQCYVSQNAVWPGGAYSVTPKTVRWWRHGVLEEPTSDLSDVVFGWSLRCPGDQSYSGDGTSFTVPSSAFSTNGECTVVITATPDRKRYYSSQSRWLYPRFFSAKPQLVSVTFDGNGGEPTTQTMAYAAGYPYGSFPDVAKTGYYCSDWYTAAEGGTRITTTSNCLASVTRLYARWSPKYCRVTYNANGGTGSMSTSWFYYDSPANLRKNTFTKSGAMFAGWATSPDGPVVYQDGSEILYLSDAYETLSLYAVWVANGYKVVFDANGGTGEMASQICSIGTCSSLRPSAFTRRGATFAGWSRTPGGKAEFADGGEVCNLASVCGETVTLYAVWNLPAVATIELTGPDVVDLYDVESAQFTAICRYANGSVVDVAPKWTITETAVTNAVISSDGLVTFPDLTKYTKASKLRVTAECNGVSASKEVDVWGWSVMLSSWTTPQRVVWPGQTLKVVPQTVTWWRHGVTEGPTEDFSNVTFSSGYGWINDNYFSDDGAVVKASGIELTIPSGVSNTEGYAQVRIITGSTRFGRTCNRYNYQTFKYLPSAPAQTVDVTFVANGGSPATQTSKYAVGYTYDYLPESVRTGYYCSWYTAAEGGTRITTASNCLASVTRLYARWSPEYYYVTYDANGGAGSMSGSWFYYDRSANLRANAFVKAGAAFVGWATSPDGPVVYQDGEEILNLSSVYVEVRLYAVWSTDCYTVAFDANGGTGNMASRMCAIGSCMTIPACTFSRMGYSFVGWAETSGGAVKYAAGAQVCDFAVSSGVTVTLYAVWQANTYAVILNRQSGSGGTSSVTATYGSAMPSITVPTRSGYVFGGYYTGTNGGGTQYYTAAGASAQAWDRDGATTLYAKWTAALPTYTVTYKPGANGTGSQQTATKTKDVALTLAGAVFTRAGYTQTGWATSDGGAKAYNLGASYTINVAVALYPVWTANTYTVTLNQQNGSGGTSSVTAAYGSAMPSITVPTRSGYAFGGYYTGTNGGGTQYYTAAGASARAWDRDGATTLYAKWTAALPTYTVTYKPGANGTGSQQTATKTKDVALTLAGAVFTRTGYTQTGWATSDGGAKAYNLGASYTINVAVALYPVWTANTYTVTLNQQNGSGGTSSVTATYGSAMPLITVPTHAGYVFGGYYTGTNGGGTQYYTSTGTSARNWDKLISTTLHAKWVFVPTYTVTYKPGANGTGSQQTATKTKDVALTLAGAVFTRAGYTQTGWATSDGGVKAYNLGASYTINAAVTLYPVWTAVASANTYILRLHRNNSERDGSTAGRTYTIGKARALPKVQNELKWAPRTGYDFLGWSRSATATSAQYTDGQSLKDLTTTAGATVHLYAVWKAHKYIVRLHRNNSKNDGATTGRAFDYDQVRFLPTMAELKWVRSGYMFMGWSQAQSSTTVKYADGLNVYNLSPNDGEELHVWGVWKKAEAGAYLLRLHRNNSERDGATAGRQLKLNTNRTLPTVKELGWTRSDATFKGWATTAKNATAGKVTYKDGATVKNLVSTPGDTVHLYAVWQ